MHHRKKIPTYFDLFPQNEGPLEMVNVTTNTLHTREGEFRIGFTLCANTHIPRKNN